MGTGLNATLTAYTRALTAPSPPYSGHSRANIRPVIPETGAKRQASPSRVSPHRSSCWKQAFRSSQAFHLSPSEASCIAIHQ